MTNNTNAIYFFVDYRFAPYTKNPGQTEDVYSTIVELYKNAEKYDIDRHRISVGGRSTGCTLALGAALKLQEKGEEHMLKQLYLLLPSINNLMWTEPNIFDELLWTDSIKFMYKKLQTFMEIAWTHSTNDYEKETRDNIYMFPGKASLA
jgi:acetyl esterase/lipase